MCYLSHDGIEWSSASVVNLLDPKEGLGRFVLVVLDEAFRDVLDGLADLLHEMLKRLVHRFVESCNRSSEGRRRHRLHR